MSYSFSLHSHESRLLKDHLENVGELSKKFIETLNLEIEHKELLCNVAYLIGISHDFGKATTFFQTKFKNESYDTEKSDHSYLSSLFAFWLIDKFLQEKNCEKFSYLSLFSWLIVAEHHSDLKSFYNIIRNIKNSYILEEQAADIRKNAIDELLEIYNTLLRCYNFRIDLDGFLNNIEKIRECIEEKIDELKEELLEYKNLARYFEFIFLYSALIDADKLDASCDNDKEAKELESKIFNRKRIDDDMVEKYKEKYLNKEKEIDDLREQAYNEIVSKLDRIDLKKEKLFSIELPTGMGKTLASFSFALKLREKIKKEYNYIPRIIYCLPFLSIIDQNSKIISKVLSIENNKITSDIFLIHHHLSDIKYTKSKLDSKEEYEEFEKDLALLLMEGWYSEIIITTFVQLFESLISTKNRALRKVHNIANSIIILDEFQAIPYEYWKLIREIIKFLAEKWNCHIIMMTATMPMIFKEDELFPLIDNPEKYFENEKLNRYTLYIDKKEKTFGKFLEELIKNIKKNNGDILIILNTIRASQEVYRKFKENFSKKEKPKITEEGIAEFNNFYLINLNSTVIPFHRLKRIEKIQEKGKRKIIISTQLVEAGVDIDVSVVYRDFAPIDAIVQSAGRCNRNGADKKGEVFIIKLVDEKGIFYSTRIYGIVFKNITEMILNNILRLEEKEIREYIKKHFVEVEKESELKFYSSVCELNFSEGREAITEFRLIKEDFGKEDFCICFENAKEIINKIKELKEIRRKVEYKKKFDISAEIKNLRRKLENFIISPWIIGKEDLIPVEPDKELWNIRVVESPEKEKIYNLETGFNLEINENFEDRFL